MINSVVLVGRLTKDVELKTVGAESIETVRFTLACDRVKKGEADFINCVAWRQSAKFLSQYAKKGNVVAIKGHITTGSYDGQNGKVFTTDVTCDEVRLIGSSDRKEEPKPIGEESLFKPKDTSLINSDDLPFF